MDSLVLIKGGLIKAKTWVYDKKKNKGKFVLDVIPPTLTTYKNHDFHANTWLLRLLNKTIDLNKNFTVRDLFKLVLNYPIFQLLDPYFKSFIEEYKNCPETNCIDSEGQIDCIEFQKIIDINDYDAPKKQKINTCEIYTDVCGTSSKDKTIYALYFTPLKEILDLPIKLSNGLISRTELNHKRNTHYLTEHVIIYYTLYDFITSFIYEISFHGTPEDKEVEGKKLIQAVKDIKSGKAKLVKLELDKKKQKGKK